MQQNADAAQSLPHSKARRGLPGVDDSDDDEPSGACESYCTGADGWMLQGGLWINPRCKPWCSKRGKLPAMLHSQLDECFAQGRYAIK